MTRPEVECDTECAADFWLCKLYDETTGYFKDFSMYPGQPLDREALALELSKVTCVGFNFKWYDEPMIVLALHGANNDQMLEANNDIIERKMPYWKFYEKWGINYIDYLDSIDLMEVAPGVRIGLKMYMGRMHAPVLWDLPFVPGARLNAVERFESSMYCGNDLIGTNLLKKELAERIQLRKIIGEQYGCDVRSKSDAQVAEAVFKAKLGFTPNKRYVPDNYQFNYHAPDYIQFITPQMKELLQLVQSVPFVVRDKEEALELFNMHVRSSPSYDDILDLPEPPKIRTGVRIPKALLGRDICIGQGKYRIGIGGLHSQESCVSYYTHPLGYMLRDIDVKSYYPSLILSLGMVPEQLGEAFQIIYRAIYERRLLAKSEAERIAYLWEHIGGEELRLEAQRLRTEADGLKIVLNGVFGKLFSKWSIFFAPELGIRVTITGQLCLLMLIEMMENSGIRVVSANTDGIVLAIPIGREWLADQIIAWWEARTKLQMESTYYKSIHFRDVNNYVAITTDGKAKRKGVFNQGGVLSGPQGKGPHMDICADAVVEFLKKGTPIEQTIAECNDIRKFIVLRGCSKGAIDLPASVAIDDGVYLGKAVRWYYGSRPGYIGTVGTGSKVAGSDWATPVMTLPDHVPADINRQHYVNAAYKMLALAGVQR